MTGGYPAVNVLNLREMAHPVVYRPCRDKGALLRSTYFSSRTRGNSMMQPNIKSNKKQSSSLNVDTIGEMPPKTSTTARRGGKNSQIMLQLTSQENMEVVPRFLVMKRVEGDFSKVSPFLIEKVLDGAIGKVEPGWSVS